MHENFFLYDTRVVKGLINLTELLEGFDLTVDTFPPYNEEWDSAYHSFYQGCMQTKEKVRLILGKEITNRQFDSFLIIAGKKLKPF